MSSGKSMPRRQTYITEVIDEEAFEADEFEDAHEQPDELEAEAEQEEQPEDEEGQEATDDVTDDLTHLAQVVTVTARKLSGITLGRKFSTGNKSKKSPDELRKVTHCSACGALGHWYQDQACPMNQGAGAGKAGKPGKGSKGSSSSSYRQTSGPDKKADRPHQVSVVHHEHLSLEVNDAPPSDYGTMFAINMVTNLPFQVHETKGFGTGGHDLTGYMVLDSACQRTCAGKAWYRSHVDMLFKHHLKTKEIPSEDVFQFGKGEPTVAHVRAYIPVFFDNHPLVVGAGILPESIPLLGSNALMDSLGSIIDLPNRVVYFSSLQCTVQLHVKGGHFAVSILDFNHEHPQRLHEWKAFSAPHVWHDPHPELLLPPQPMNVKVSASTSTSNSLLKPPQDLPHADGAALMASALAPLGLMPRGLQEEHLDLHGGGRAIGHHAQGMAGPCSAAGDEPTTSSREVPAHGDQAVRQCAWQVRTLPNLPSKMEMEQQEGRLGHLVFPRRWLSRFLFSTIAIATAVIEGNGICREHQQSSTEAQGQEHGSTMFDLDINSFGLDELRDGLHAPHRPLDSGGAGGGLQDPGAEVTAGSRADHRGGVRLPQRGALQTSPGEAGVGGRSKEARTPGGAGRVDRGGRGNHGLGPHRRDCEVRRANGPDGPPRTIALKSGQAKRLRGDWNKAADILEKEYQVYATSKPTMERPPPYADLWELFAGSSNMTRLAAQYNLNTLQPMDLLYGQNFKDPAMRKMIFQKLDHYKPWLVIMGVDCRLWNQFNINLNWSSPDRRLALRHLQDDEKVLVEFAVAVALRQHRAGRYFLLENPQRSQLWNLEEVTDLLGLRGVWTTDLDCGAYGAEVDGQPIAKPMRWAGNQPGLHEQLNRRLTPLQKMYCTPIQGKLTRRSQEYPDELCHAVLQELRALIFQKEPLRFGPPQHKVYATAYPTSDLDLWDDIVKYVDNVYERGAKRPFNFPVDSDMGKRIQELFRIKAVRIQAFYAPTSRRIPANVDEYFTRAAFSMLTRPEQLRSRTWTRSSSQDSGSQKLLPLAFSPTGSGWRPLHRLHRLQMQTGPSFQASPLTSPSAVSTELTNT